MRWAHYIFGLILISGLQSFGMANDAVGEVGRLKQEVDNLAQRHQALTPEQREGPEGADISKRIGEADEKIEGLLQKNPDIQKFFKK